MADPDPDGLWPARGPFREGWLEVGKTHRLRYALHGNPRGQPVFFLHGGPGCGCDEDDARWFDPQTFRIVTHDQRGAGRSEPRGEINENTPQDLVEDLVRLRTHLRIHESVFLFGGSWGATLALLYAQAHPRTVAAMILRGTFLCSYEDQDRFYAGEGAGRHAPEAYERLVAALPAGSQRIQEKLHRALESAGTDEERRRWCRLQGEYEYALFGVPAEEAARLMEASPTLWQEMRINNYYQAHRFFLTDGQILQQTERLVDIPITFVHGDQDRVCPLASVRRLHERLPRSRLVVVPGAGHLSGEPGVRAALLASVAEWSPR
jgi:proline iminopeptidase